MSSLFNDTLTLTTSDYQLLIEQTYVGLNNVENNSHLGFAINRIKNKLVNTDTVLLVLKDNVLNNNKALNLRNLQVFKSLLLDIQLDLRKDRISLDSSEKKLNAMRVSLRSLITDTTLRQLFRNDTLREQFGTQFRELRTAFRGSATQLRESLATVNLLQTRISSNLITTNQLLENVNNLLTSSATRIFSKEYNFLWEKDNIDLADSARLSVDKAYLGERKAVQYYFRDSGFRRVILLLLGILFFIWTYRNIRGLKAMDGMEAIKDLRFAYLPKRFILAAFVVIFAIAPLFDLHAPAVYIESMQFLLLIVLTILFWRKWPRKRFFHWLAMVILFICFSFTHHVVDPGFIQRSWLIVLNVVSVLLALTFLPKEQNDLRLRKFIRFVIILHVIMNISAVLFNVFGRFTLAQILGNAAIFGLTQAIGLAVFSKICMEAILLQIVTSRIKRGVKTDFEFKHVLRSFSRPILTLIIVLWLIVLATNLNLYNAALTGLTTLLETPRSIGNAFFTFGGILLFFMIIWIAHLLQKYVGYFFGDTGADDEVQNKTQRSRLLIARLILLCVGYLLAVTASGIPVDKITIVLGALGVGIGLGLQNIVSNFVSGIILIFDRPLQIGDVVEIGNKKGKVREIGLRSSTLLTQEGAEVIIPNGDILSQHITNWTLSNTQQRLEIDLTVTGSKDMELVASTIKKAILSSEHILKTREPQILFVKVNDDGYALKAFCWSNDVSESDTARSEILLQLHEQLNAENIYLK
jgi:small-conductance mechanosensitive channel